MIKTTNLLIKPLVTDQGQQVARLLSDPVLLAGAHLVFASQPVTSFEVNFLLNSCRVYGIYRLLSKKDLVGIVLLDRAVANLPADWEIGYLLRRDLWGREIMTEAVRGVLTTLNQAVVAVTDCSNHPSQQILKKNGFMLASREKSRLVWRRPACVAD